MMERWLDKLCLWTVAWILQAVVGTLRLIRGAGSPPNGGAAPRPNEEDAP